MMSPLRGSLMPLTSRPAGLGTQSYRDLILLSSPVAYWRLGESSGTTAVDEMGSYNGTYMPNSAGSWTGGTLGQAGALTGDSNTAALFNGTSGYVATSGLGAVIGGATAATIEAWIYRDSTSKIVTLGFSGGSHYRFEFVWYSDGNIYFEADNSNTTQCYAYAALPGVGWHHIVLVFDGALSGTSRLRAVADGTAQTLTFFNSPPSTLPISANLGAFDIGRDANQGRYANGRIDEVALYTAALGTTTALAHYNKGLTG